MQPLLQSFTNRFLQPTPTSFTLIPSLMWTMWTMTKDTEVAKLYTSMLATGSIWCCNATHCVQFTIYNLQFTICMAEACCGDRHLTNGSLLRVQMQVRSASVWQQKQQTENNNNCINQKYLQKNICFLQCFWLKMMKSYEAATISPNEISIAEKMCHRQAGISDFLILDECKTV